VHVVYIQITGALAQSHDPEELLGAKTDISNKALGDAEAILGE
jgi:hypothetical protein